MTYRDFRHLKLSRLILPPAFVLGCLLSPATLLIGAVLFAGLVVLLGRAWRPL